MVEEIRKIFSDEFISMYDSFEKLRESKAEWRYTFMDDIEYSKITDPKIAATVYWKEMLSRAHIISLVSIFKTLRWIESLEKNSKNYYGFCTSLRGLIESCSDTFYTLSKVPLTLAIDFRVIKEQMNGNSIVLTDHGKLEHEMLHFIQGTKLTKDQRIGLPEYHNAKHLTEYIVSIDNENKDVSSLYNILCGVAHPSYDSNQILLFCYEGETIVCNDSYDLEASLIKNLIEAKSDVILALLRPYYNNILSVLCVLNEFNVSSIETHLCHENDFKSEDIWKDIVHRIEESDTRYKNALMSGKYE